MKLLDAVELVLGRENRALSAKELANLVREADLAPLNGATPWKSIGARLAVDIRSNELTPFIRVGRGRYGLKAWPDAEAFAVAPRKIHPLDEDILVLSRGAFLEMISTADRKALYDVDYRDILSSTFVRNRRVAEESEEFVQIIPSFVIFRGEEVLSFRRTRKSPEQRLHDRYSIVFGGHLQSEDDPGLFSNFRSHAELFLFRELHEELAFSEQPLRSQYVGVLYLQESKFERQHAGIVFAIDLPMGATAKSMEPGYHSSLSFIPWEAIEETPVVADRWSEACIEQIKGSTGGE